MCRFKSGIILKNKCYMPNKDHHAGMLEELSIEDNYENAIRKFVRAELVPDNNEWWTSPDGWKFVVDQDEIPDWFADDRGKYEEQFRETVKAWWQEHVLIDKKIDVLKNGEYRLKRCEVKRLLNDVTVMCDSSTVTEMYNNSTVTEMYGSSAVSRMYNNSTVTRMCDSSTVSVMYNNSTVTVMCGSSTVSRMYGNSAVSRMCDSSTVSRMCDSSTVSVMYGNSTVTRMYGSSAVSRMCGNSTVSVMYGNSTVSVMCDSSTVSVMYDSSIARDYANGIIHISEDCNLEVVKRENKEEAPC